MKLNIKRMLLITSGLLLANSLCAGPLLDKMLEKRQAKIENQDPYTIWDTGMKINESELHNVKIYHDIAYAEGKDHTYDIYIPQNVKENAPVIFMVHGGAWLKGDKASKIIVLNKVNYWIPKGYIFVSVNYNLSGDPESEVNDVAQALSHVQKNIKNYGGNNKDIIVMGHSAGAHLVSLLSVDPNIVYRSGGMTWLGTVSLDSAAMDVTELMRKPHFDFYDRVFGDNVAFWKKMSPTERVGKQSIPIFLVCSTQRRLSCSQAKGLQEQYDLNKRDATVLPVNLSHSQINDELGLQGQYTDAIQTFVEQKRGNK